jgi:hypothetical protein
MDTIYNEILKRKTTRSLGDDLTSAISLKLVKLLKASCNIDLSGIEVPFQQTAIIDLSELSWPLFGIAPDGTFYITFHFIHGVVSLHLYPDKQSLTLSFGFKYDHLDFILPSNSKSCNVTIDNNMNFIDCNFEVGFLFSTVTLNNIESKRIFDMDFINPEDVHKIEDETDSLNEIIYYNYLHTLTSYELDPLLINHDLLVQSIFTKLMGLHSKYPHICYSGFENHLTLRNYLNDNNS